MKTQLSPQDWQQLSAYLDGQLSTTEKERLETRLRSQSNLRSGLEEISQTRTVLRSVPRRKVPHNFVLTRAMVAEQAQRRSAWFPVLGFTSLISMVLLVVVTLLFQFQAGAAPAAAPVAMQAAARADKAGPAQPTSQPEIIQWGPGGIGGRGGGDGGANPQGSGMGGAQPQNNTLMSSQPTPEAGIEAAPGVSQAGVPNPAAANPGAPTEAPAATSEPAMAAPLLEGTPTEGAPATPAATEQPPENTPTSAAGAQEKTVPNQAEGPVILGVAPTQDQGLIQTTPAAPENNPAPSAPPLNFLPFIQAGLVVLAVIAGILAFLIRKKT